MQYITVTNNYFADQNTYIAAAGLPKNTKLKKADLYDEIETWNRVCAVTLDPVETVEEELARVQADLNAATFDEIPTNVVEITTDNSFDELFANWEQAKAEKTTPKPAAAKPDAPKWTAANDRLVADFHAIEDRAQQAMIVYELRQSHSVQAIVVKIENIDRAQIRRKVNSVTMFHSIPEIRTAIEDGVSWANFENRVGKMSLNNDRATLIALVERLKSKKAA